MKINRVDNLLLNIASGMPLDNLSQEERELITSVYPYFFKQSEKGEYTLCLCRKIEKKLVV